MVSYQTAELTAVTILVDLGEFPRLDSSRQAVRFAGMNVTVHESDQRGAPGHLNRQGPPAPRRAPIDCRSGRVTRADRSPDRPLEHYIAESGSSRIVARSMTRRLGARDAHHHARSCTTPDSGSSLTRAAPALALDPRNN
jgi:transposase